MTDKCGVGCKLSLASVPNSRTGFSESKTVSHCGDLDVKHKVKSQIVFNAHSSFFEHKYTEITSPKNVDM